MPPGRPRHAAAVRSAARSAAARTSDSTLVSTACATSSSGSGRPVNADVIRSRSRPTRACRVRSSSPVPTNSCQRASTSPAQHASRPGRRRRPPGPRPRKHASTSSRSVAAAAPCSSACRASAGTRCAHAAQRAVQGAAHHLGPGGGVRGQPHQPAAQRRDRVRRDPPAGQRHLRHGEQRGPAQPVVGQHPAEVRADLGHRLRRHPVEHHRQRGAALLGGVQQVPRHRVGVPGRGGDEDPQVGGGEQLGGQLRGCRRPRSPRPARRAAPARAARPGAARSAGSGRRRARRPTPVTRARSGQHPGVGEPAALVRRADQHRRPGGRPEHPGRADVGAEQRVDQRRLAGAGGAADDGEQRGVELAEPGQQVVVDLPDQLVAGAARLVHADQPQAEPHAGHPVAQGGERGGQLGQALGHVRMLSRPAAGQPSRAPSRPSAGSSSQARGPKLAHRSAATSAAYASASTAAGTGTGISRSARKCSSAPWYASPAPSVSTTGQCPQWAPAPSRSARRPTSAPAAGRRSPRRKGPGTRPAAPPPTRRRSGGRGRGRRTSRPRRAPAAAARAAPASSCRRRAGRAGRRGRRPARAAGGDRRRARPRRPRPAPRAPPADPPERPRH